MPRKKKINIDIEDSLSFLDDPKNTTDSLDDYTAGSSGVFNSYPESEYEYDMDNYGYNEGYESY